MILFVGTQEVGFYVPEIAGDQVQFTGTVHHIADLQNIILHQEYSRIIIDVRQFTDTAQEIAEQLSRLQKAVRNRFIFFALGHSASTELVSALLAKDFVYFVTSPLIGRAREELRACLNGYATIEPPHEQPVYQEYENTRQTAEPGIRSIAVVGSCPRIGTTTQAIQICKYLQLKGKNPCYISMSHDKAYEWREILSDIEVTRDDDAYARTRIQDLDMYDDPAKIAKIKAMGYDWIVYDFGYVQESSFTPSQYLEKDYRIVVAGIKPSEIRGMKKIYDSLLSDSTYYIFSFISDDTKASVLQLQNALADKTEFAMYAPDPFTLSSKAVNIYDNILEVKASAKKTRRGLFGRKGK